MKHVFISYSHEDKDFAQKVFEVVEEAKHTAWMDARGIPIGAEWRNEIDSAMRTSYAAIVVMSPASEVSKYVNYEIGFVAGVAIDVVPLLYKHLSGKFDTLDHRHYMDFTNEGKYSWEELIASLNESRRKRTNAANSIENIMISLKENDIPGYMHAIDLLSEFESPQAYEKLLEIIDTVRYRNVRAHGLSKLITLTKSRDTRAILTLKNLLTSDHIESRLSIVKVIEKIGYDDRCVAILSEALHDTDSGVRSSASQILKHYGSQITPYILRSVISDRSRHGQARKLLIELGDDIIPDLIVALESNELNVRELAKSLLKAKAKSTGNRISEELLHLLKKGNVSTRTTSTQLLAGVDDPKVISELVKNLSDSNLNIRLASAQALEETAAPQTTPALIKALDDLNNLVHDAAFKAIAQIGIYAITHLLKALPRSNRETRVDIIRLIGHIGSAEAVRELVMYHYDRDTDVREAVRDALKAIGVEQANPELQVMLGDRDESKRAVAAWAMAEVPHPTQIPTLIKALEDKSVRVRTNAALALGQSGDAVVVKPLIKTCRFDRDKAVQRSAAQALKEIGTDEALKVATQWFSSNG